MMYSRNSLWELFNGKMAFQTFKNLDIMLCLRKPLKLLRRLLSEMRKIDNPRKTMKNRISNEENV